MAGANMNGGTVAETHNVPTMGSESGSAPVGTGGHTEGTAPSYPEAFGAGPDGKGYPAGTQAAPVKN